MLRFLEIQIGQLLRMVSILVNYNKHRLRDSPKHATDTMQCRHKNIRSVDHTFQTETSYSRDHEMKFRLG